MRVAGSKLRVKQRRFGIGDSPETPIANRGCLSRKLRRPVSAAKVSRMPDDVLASDPLWYKDAIIYELHVKTFHDSTGDGMGDFRGPDRASSIIFRSLA